MADPYAPSRAALTRLVSATSNTETPLELHLPTSRRTSGLRRERALRAAERPFVELGERLSRLVGSEGYRALVARSLHLAAAEFPVLSALRPTISPPGRLVILYRSSREARAAEVRNAVAAALAALLYLLEQFIGADLTQRIVGEVWPWLSDGSRHRSSPRSLTG